MNEFRQYDINYLREKLNRYREGAIDKYDWYGMSEKVVERGIVTPPVLKDYYKSVMGWCEKAVESLSDRLVFREFANDSMKLNDIFTNNNADIFFDSAIKSALISSCCFVYISKQKDSPYPKLQIIEGYNATGVIDDTSFLLKYGYAVLERDANGTPILEAYFTPEETIYYYNQQNFPIYNQTVFDQYPDAPLVTNKYVKPKVVRIPHDAGQCLLVPVIYKPDASRPFGRSRITKACIYQQRYAKRTLERADVTAEFYSFPQKYVVGTDPDNEPLDTWRATISTMLEITKGQDGEKPTLGQFTQPSMEPFIKQLRMSAGLFAGETGLTVDDLGFPTDNPSSVEAIIASHENLRLVARKAQKNFAVHFKNVGYVAKCLADGFPYKREEFVKMEAKWEPIFEPTASALSTMGDATIKINQAMPGYFDKESFRDFTGIKGSNDA